MIDAHAPAAPASVALLIIGNEILSGRTQDANMAFIGRYLGERGLRLAEARVVPDEAAIIIETVRSLAARYTYVFTTGGIGSTHDDITAACMAAAFGVPLLRHPEAARRLEQHYAGTGLLNEARMRMANVPEGGILIDNPLSAAPGFQIGNVFVMAGVPAIMQAMLTGIGHRLVGGPVLLTRTVISGVPEGSFADALRDIAAACAPWAEIGSYPAFRHGKISTSLVIRSADLQKLDETTGQIVAMLRALGGQPQIIEGYGPSSDQDSPTAS
jgi:molybdenum cofactor synthesis domain-containing protein